MVSSKVGTKKNKLTLILSILAGWPLARLYRLADWIIYPIMYYIIRYRRKIVRRNIAGSFPNLTKKEVVRLEKRFYHHFADIAMEIIHSWRASDEEIRERMQIDNVDEVVDWARQNGGVIFLLGHIGNWEWTADIHHLLPSGIRHYNVYRRLNNEKADQWMRMVRERRSGTDSGIEKNSLLRALMDIRQKGEPFTLGLISDQKVSPGKQCVRTMFLNRITAFVNGGEHLARKYGYAVGYVHITALERGKYKAHVKLLSDKPLETAPNEITCKFAQELEQNIAEQPEQWLWSHNRWKWDEM